MADGSRRWDRIRSLFGGAANRGFQLDLFVFVLNLTVMALLSNWFVGTIRRASAEDKSAMTVLLALSVAAFVLAPLGATLKRWHVHQRLRNSEVMQDHDPMGSCLFNPIFYFCLSAVIFATINAFVFQSIYGLKEPPGEIFIGSILVGIVLMILHTVLVYRYFVPLKSAPKSEFLRNPISGTIGDVCLFLNMAIFQLFWNLLSFGDLPRPTGGSDLIGRILILVFLALLVYFPPRMFYLAEDIGKRRTWLMVLLANSPILVRFIYGTSAGSLW